MNMQELFQNVSLETIQVVAVVGTILLMVVVIAWSKRSMGKLGESWAQVAELNGLQYATNPVSYDYGGVLGGAIGSMVIGSQTFEYPGMAGTYRGRNVQIQTSAGMQQHDAGKWMLEAVVTLNNPKPFSALSYKRPFEKPAKERIKKDVKTGLKAIDGTFKIRSENTDFVSQVFQNTAFAEAIKQQKFKSAHFMFDGNRLQFIGAVGGRQANPEQAIALLNLLSDIADAAR
jgi:hypothetical protein